ncbi:hypothetical protein E2C01_015334 [Portunus trituberculatus]|uniref:Uncharacterized protein n=1 Tax=Portunus trituberculatus TaxID=210409 RepID=A0A5B7DMQ7_PORTR|nr:hypothetical protein [Portunus trituberculatus]
MKKKKKKSTGTTKSGPLVGQVGGRAAGQGVGKGRPVGDEKRGRPALHFTGWPTASPLSRVAALPLPTLPFPYPPFSNPFPLPPLLPPTEFRHIYFPVDVFNNNNTNNAMMQHPPPQRRTDEIAARNTTRHWRRSALDGNTVHPRQSTNTGPPAAASLIPLHPSPPPPTISTT